MLVDFGKLMDAGRIPAMAMVAISVASAVAQFSGFFAQGMVVGALANLVLLMWVGFEVSKREGLSAIDAIVASAASGVISTFVYVLMISMAMAFKGSTEGIVAGVMYFIIGAPMGIAIWGVAGAFLGGVGSVFGKDNLGIKGRWGGPQTFLLIISALLFFGALAIVLGFGFAFEGMRNSEENLHAQLKNITILPGDLGPDFDDFVYTYDIIPGEKKAYGLYLVNTSGVEDAAKLYSKSMIFAGVSEFSNSSSAQKAFGIHVARAAAMAPGGEWTQNHRDKTLIDSKLVNISAKLGDEIAVIHRHYDSQDHANDVWTFVRTGRFIVVVEDIRRKDETFDLEKTIQGNLGFAKTMVGRAEKYQMAAKAN